MNSSGMGDPASTPLNDMSNLYSSSFKVKFDQVHQETQTDYEKIITFILDFLREIEMKI